MARLFVPSKDGWQLLKVSNKRVCFNLPSGQQVGSFDIPRQVIADPPLDLGPELSDDVGMCVVCLVVDFVKRHQGDSPRGLADCETDVSALDNSWKHLGTTDVVRRVRHLTLELGYRVFGQLDPIEAPRHFSGGRHGD